MWSLLKLFGSGSFGGHLGGPVGFGGPLRDPVGFGGPLGVWWVLVVLWGSSGKISKIGNRQNLQTWSNRWDEGVLARSVSQPAARRAKYKLV